MPLLPVDGAELYYEDTDDGVAMERAASARP
jgi:hypothetical protein